MSLKKKEQETLSLTICALLSYQPIVHFINTIMNYFVSEQFIYDTIVCFVILLLLITKSLLIVVKKVKKDVLAAFVIVTLIFLITYILYENNREYMFTSIFDLTGNPIYNLVVFNFSAYIFTRYIDNYNIFNIYLSKFSVIVIILSTLTFFMLLKQNIQLEYMVFSYNMLIHTIYITINFIENKKLISGIISLMAILIIFTSGARGPIVIVMFTIIVYYLLRKTKISTKYTGIISLTIFAKIIYDNFKGFLFWINSFSSNLGIKSRTIEKIITNNFFDDSGRSTILEKQIHSISLIGNGIYGDRDIIDGIYAHNIIVELLVQFGYLFGTVIIILMLIIAFSGIQSKNAKIRTLSIIFLSSGFLKLFLSGSYLNQEPSFYILMGLGVNSLIEGRRKENENSVAMQFNITKNCKRPIKN